MDRIGRVIQRKTTYGKYKDTSIAIDEYIHKGTTIQKRYVTWGETWQRIVNKVRGKDGKMRNLYN